MVFPSHKSKSLWTALPPHPPPLPLLKLYLKLAHVLLRLNFKCKEVILAHSVKKLFFFCSMIGRDLCCYYNNKNKRNDGYHSISLGCGNLFQPIFSQSQAATCQVPTLPKGHWSAAECEVCSPMYYFNHRHCLGICLV